MCGARRCGAGAVGPACLHVLPQEASCEDALTGACRCQARLLRDPHCQEVAESLRGQLTAHDLSEEGSRGWGCRVCAKPLESCPAPCDPTRLLCWGPSPGENTGDDGCIFLSREPGVALGQDLSGLGGLGALGTQEAAWVGCRIWLEEQREGPSDPVATSGGRAGGGRWVVQLRGPLLGLGSRDGPQVEL